MRTNTRIKLCAVLLAGNAAETEVTAVPSTAFACIPVITVGGGLMVMLSALTPLCDPVSVACTVKVLVPAAPGKPEITPVSGARLNPPGNAPETTDHA